MKFLNMKRISLPLLALSLSMIGAQCQNSEVDVSTPLGLSAQVTGVSVSGDSQVTISGNSKLKAFAFIMDDPVRVAVDVKGATLSSDVEKEMAGAGMISRVEINQLDLNPPVVRVICYVPDDVDYQLESEGKALILTVMRPQAGGKDPEQVAEEGTMPYDETKDELEALLAGRPTPTMSASSAPMPSGGPVQYSGAGESSSQYPPILPDMPPPNANGSANMVGDIYYRTGDEGIQIMIMTNGPVADFLDFDIVNPPKLVLDLWGCRDQTPKNVFPLKWGGVDQIRVGVHYDKTRVVIDFSGALKAYDIKRTNSGLVVTIGKAPYVQGAGNFKTRTTGTGQSLRSIAQAEYGNPDNWPRLVSANRDRFTNEELKQFISAEGALVLGENLDIRVPVR